MTPRKRINNVWVLAIVAAASFMLLSGATLQQAFAHASTTLTLDEDPVDGKKIRVTVGHTNEPTFGVKPGIHDGKHNFEVILADSDTRLPLTGASLKADKYYFKNIKSFKEAETPDDADDIEKGITVGSVFGDPGRYMTRQVQKDGIYGYRLYGTISYFNEATIDIDSTVFCSSSEGDTKKFNSAGWTGSFGCTEDIVDILFPERNRDANLVSGNGEAAFEMPVVDGGSAQIKQASLVTGSTPAPTTAMNIAASTNAPAPLSASFFQLMAALGIPAAAVASFFGIRSIRQGRRDSAL
jgi:hypothetical protein